MRHFTERVSKIKIKLYVVCGKTCVYTNTNTHTHQEKLPKRNVFPTGTCNTRYTLGHGSDVRTAAGRERTTKWRAVQTC